MRLHYGRAIHYSFGFLSTVCEQCHQDVSFSAVYNVEALYIHAGILESLRYFCESARFIGSLITSDSSETGLEAHVRQNSQCVIAGVCGKGYDPFSYNPSALIVSMLIPSSASALLMSA